MTYFLAAPLIISTIFCGWAGLAGAIVGQVAGVQIWIAIHETIHRKQIRGVRIDKVLNRLIGRWRNHAALWVTTIVVPMFWLIRMSEVFFYPLLRGLTGFPRYEDRDWVNVSRQKFTGLVGHDLIWCLYCDWMTGVWSLGSEILRNVESFWCPIRFLSDKKCANCSVDFPDVNNGWIPADGTMAEVCAELETQHGNGTRAWFGHPVRLTVGGKTLEPVEVS